MRAKEVMKVLNISNPTLYIYLKNGYIKATKYPNGRYNFDEDSVYDFLNKGVKRKTYVYCRVSTSSQKQDLQDQIDMCKNYCFQNGYELDGIYADIASGISFEKRDKFFEMLDDILDKKVKRVIITYKDRLSRVGFELFKVLFNKFGCEIVVISEVGSTKLDSEEIFEELISLLHCYSMKMYSKSIVSKIKEVLSEPD